MATFDTLFSTHETAFETEEKRRWVVENTSIGDRQMMIKNLVFRYPKFDEIVGELTKFHAPVEGGVVQCGYAGGFIGDSQSGKTSIVRAFRRIEAHQPYVLDDGMTQYPVAFVQGVEQMNRGDLVSGIFDATEAPSTPRMTRDTVKKLAAWRVQMSGVKLIILDDAHFVFEGRRDIKAGVIGILKDLLDKRLCNILLVGMTSIDSGLLDFVQLYRRGHFPAQRIDDFDETKTLHKVEYLGFLNGVSIRLPFLRDSNLQNPEYFPHFLEQTKGLKGATMDIIVDAGNRALDERATHVSGRHLYEACFKRARPGQKTIPFQGVA